jgi:hypothetical protein
MNAIVPVKFVAEVLKHLDGLNHGRTVTAPIPWAFSACATRNISLFHGAPEQHRDELKALRGPLFLHLLPAMSAE